MRAILRALETTKDGTLNERFFFDLLQRAFSEDDARAQLNTAVNWGRYADMFTYDSESDRLRLNHTTEPASSQTPS